MHFSTVDHASSPPRVVFPRPYNAAVDLLDRNVAEGRGDKIAIVDDRESITYAALLDRVKLAATAFRTLDVRPEDRVVLVMLDTIDFVVAFLGAMRIGAVPVPLNTLLTSSDYAYMIADSRARVVIASDALLPKVKEAIAKSGSAVVLLACPSPLGGDMGDLSRFDEAIERARATSARDAFEPTTADDVAFWLYSSGSTGAPKGAVHLHAHLMRTAALYAQGVLGIREADRVYSAAKLFFAYGLGNALTFPFSVGATAILTAERPTPAAVTRIMKAHDPTIFCGVPTLFASLLATDSFAASKSLRVSTSAGEALPKHVGEAWHAKTATHILDGIGSTEMLHIFLSNRPDDIRYGTSGKAVPGYELKVVDENDTHVADGEEGSLWVRGETAASMYWNQRERSLATFHGPWTRTGDRYVRDADGYYTYSGRADDMLKVGGIWVSPFEVESAIASHDAVLEAAVVGHADENGLVKPKAFVVLKNRSHASDALVAELKAFVKEKLAPYKYPRWIELVNELPKTATGKIQRFRLRG